MKSYDVKIEQDSEKNRSFIVKVECEEDFIEWYNILSFFEKEKKISFKEIKNERKEK